MRPIDADALLKKLNDNSIAYNAYVNHFILNAPTVYAMPVIYAHWIPCENETGEGSNTYKCSTCGEIQMIISGTPKDNGWKYCPHCGAKMDEENYDRRD